MSAKRKEKKSEVVAAAEIEVPEFTISADSPFGIHCMIAIKGVAAAMHLPHEEQKAIAVKLREFDLYEEITRG